jgi:hypothetical protein
VDSHPNPATLNFNAVSLGDTVDNPVSLHVFLASEDRGMSVPVTVVVRDAVPSEVTLVAATIYDPTDADPSFSAGDVIRFVLRSSDTAGLVLGADNPWIPGRGSGIMSRAEVDLAVQDAGNEEHESFSQNFGNEYTGRWIRPALLVTVVDPGSSQAISLDESEFKIRFPQAVWPSAGRRYAQTSREWITGTFGRTGLVRGGGGGGGGVFFFFFFFFFF